jgi:hypothetical protein
MTDTMEQTTGWFVYGVVGAGTTLPDDLDGIDGQQVRLHAHGRVAVLTSPYELERTSGRAADLMAYDAVLDAVARAGVAVAPVRFGSVVEDEEQLREDLLEPGEPVFAATLQRLKGRRQYLLQGVYTQELLLAAVVAADPEVAELRALTRELPEDAAYAERVRLGELVARAVEEQQAADAELVLTDVVPLVEDVAERPVPGLELAFDVALLVPDDQVEQLEERLERLAEELHPRLRLQLRGPTAPYDFAGGG